MTELRGTSNREEGARGLAELTALWGAGHPIGWLLWSTGRRIVHVIRPRGYEVCVALIGAGLTVRVFPVMHGPKTRDGSVGWDDIDQVELPRR